MAHSGKILLILALVPLLLLPAACGRREGQTITRKMDVFGTIVEITIRDADRDVAAAALEEIGRAFSRMHRDWHAWKPGELSRLNAALARGKRVKVSPFLLPLLKQAKHFEEISDGLFNPAIGAIIAAWGFHSDKLPKGTRPPFAKIRALVRRHPSMKDVIIEGDMVHARNRAVQLDFGGFAKGEAVDRAMAILERHGIRNAIVNAGGDLDVMGSHGDRPWVAGIRHPKHWGIIATVELKDGEALHTSGNYFRYREYEGIRHGHIIDPRTGMAVSHVVSVSVLDTSGALADAAATALSVAGPKDLARIARRMGVDRVMMVDDGGTVYITPAMKARVRFAEGEPKRLVVVP